MAAVQTRVRDHCWCRARSICGLLCTYVVPQDFGGAWWNFIPKVIADQTVWSIFLNAAYSTMIMGLQGMSPDKVTSLFPTLT